MFAHDQPPAGLQQAVQTVDDLLLVGDSAKHTDADDFVERAVVPSSPLLEGPVTLECWREVLNFCFTRYDLVLVAQASLLRSLSQRAVHANSRLDAIDCLDVGGVGEAV